jgi:hypothetical protein
LSLHPTFRKVTKPTHDQKTVTHPRQPHPGGRLQRKSLRNHHHRNQGSRPVPEVPGQVRRRAVEQPDDPGPVRHPGGVLLVPEAAH